MATPPSRTRTLVIALGVLLVLGLAFILLVRRALDPDTQRAVAERRLSSLLGQPVRIGRMRVSVLPTLVEGSEITVGSATRAAPSLSLRAVRIFPVLSTVFSQPLVIDRVELDGLLLNVRRDADGRWHLPFSGAPPDQPPVAPGTADTDAVDVREVLLREGRLVVTDDVLRSPTGTKEVAEIESIAAVVRRESGVTRLESATASVGGATISGTGSAGREGLRLTLAWESLRPADLPQVFALIGAEAPEGLSLEGRRPLDLDLAVGSDGVPSGTGRLSAERVRYGTLELTKFVAPFTFSNNQLTLDPMTFEAYGGSQRGRLSADIAATPARWTLQGVLDRVDVDRFLSANTTAKNQVSGTGRLDANLRGRAATPATRDLAGRVDAAIANGAIRNFPMLAAITSALNVAGGSGNDTTFERLSATFDVGANRAATNNLRLVARDLSVTGAGSITFDQVLDFSGRATLSQGQSQQLIASVHELRNVTDAQGRIEVPMRVSGTLSQPRFQVDVARMLTGAAQRELKRQLDRTLKRLFKP